MNPSQIKTIIFDLYGTLIHIPDDSKPYNKLWDYYGIVDTKTAKRLVLTNPNQLNPVSTHIQDLKENLNLSFERNYEFEKEIGKNIRDDISRSIKYSEVEHVLSSLINQKINLSLLSNVANPYIYGYYLNELYQWILKIKSFFSCDTDVMVIKPEPEIYLRALEWLKLKPEETLMIGDSLICDVEGPKSVGMHALHLDRSKGDTLISVLTNAGFKL